LAKKTRLVIRRSLKNISVQFIDYNPKGDKVILSVHSKDLEKFEWKMNKGNIPSAYLTGILAGKKAKKFGVGQAVLDIGLNKSVKASRIYAALKGVLDSGVQVTHSKDVLPSDERVTGRHIADYVAKLKGNEEKQGDRFSGYAKAGLSADVIKSHFNDTKKRILGV